jgi:hypothetical protein
MDKTSELQQRKNKLLDGNDLSTSIAKMIRVKDLPATFHSATAIAGRDGRTEIVLELFIDVLNTEKIARVYLYITEDIFDPESFDYIDCFIGPKVDKVSINSRIKLRALRTVYNVIKNISTGYANAVDPNKIIYVRTQKTGMCDYRN